MNSQRTALRIATAILFAQACAIAQTLPMPELAGDWNAALEVGGTRLRLVLHIAKTDTSFSATLDSVDQSAMGLRVDLLRREGSHLHFEMTEIGAGYDGDWNPTSRQIEGHWKQGPADLPLAWTRANATASPKQTEQPISASDRAYLIDYLSRTGENLVRAVSNLTPAQWTFKADPSRWSIAECVEHLVLEEQTLSTAITQKVVKIPPSESQPRLAREHDERIIRMLTDRTQKASAAESVQPNAPALSAADGVSRFSKARDETIDWVRSTKIDLRAHGTPNPVFQFMDAYGDFILLAAHSARHTAQIEEVKAASGFPK